MAKLEKAICETCSKEFSYYRSTLRGKDGRFCSRKCIKHQAWNKGKVNYSSCRNCGKQVRAWRKYCSSKCYQEQIDPTSYLPIQPWAEYVELRFDINNCRTLCMACHYKITFGKDMPKGVTAWGHNLSQIGGY